MFFLSAELISVLCPETSAFFLVIYFPSLADMNSEHLNVDFSIFCTFQRKNYKCAVENNCVSFEPIDLKLVERKDVKS